MVTGASKPEVLQPDEMELLKLYRRLSEKSKFHVREMFRSILLMIDISRMKRLPHEPPDSGPQQETPRPPSCPLAGLSRVDIAPLLRRSAGSGRPGPDQLIDVRKVCALAGLSRTEVYRRIRAGTFPKQTHIGDISRWSENEVVGWAAARLSERESVED